MDVIELPATLTAFGSSPVPATATVLDQTPGQRMVRTAAGLGACWGMALITLFIPVAHFILVPTFLTAGIVVAVLRAREARRLLKVSGTCPRCGAAQDFKAGGRLTAERSLDCPRCHTNLTLSTDAALPTRA